MANQDQVGILLEGAKHWNAWRRKHPDVGIDLSDEDIEGPPFDDNSNEIDLTGIDLTMADLHGAEIIGVNFSGANLSFADLRRAKLIDVDLSGADLNNALLSGTDLSDSNFSNANLTEVDLTGANLSDANLSGAMLKDATLEYARFVNTNLSNAVLEGCSIYGVSAWGLILDGANQKNLRITPDKEPAITADDLEVAQFIYLMLNNQKVRHVINTLTTKVVLILGRFTKKRKAVLDAMREELRRQDYLPIIFDFEQPATRDLTETVSTLAHMARFIIADITDPRSIPQELQTIVPHLPSVPVQPLILASEHEYGMFEHFKRYQWVLETHVYESSKKLVAELKEKVIAPAEAKAKELRG